MSRQGTIKIIENDRSVLGGEVTIPRLVNSRIRLERIPKFNADKSPDYVVQVPCYDENADETYWGEVGSGWDKEKKENPDYKYISIVVNLHDGRGDINFSALPAFEEQQPEGWKEGDETLVYNFKYSPPRAKPSNNAAPTSKGKVDDEIRF